MRKWLGDLEMTKKLLVSPFVAVLFVAVFGVVSYGAFFKQKAVLDDIFNNRFSYFQATADILIEMREVQAGIADLASMMNQGEKIAADEEPAEAKNAEHEGAGGSEYRTGVSVAFKRAVNEARNHELEAMKRTEATIQEVLKSNGLSKDERAAFAVVQQKIGSYLELVNKIVRMDEKDFTAAQAMMIDVENCYKDMEKDVRYVLDLERKLGKERYASAGLAFKVALAVTLIVFVAAMTLPFGISLLMKSVILSPIRKTVEIIESLSQGDLTRRIDITSSDEIGEMARHLNLHADKLHEVITHVAASSERVSSAAHILDGSSEQIATGAEEVAGRVSAVATASEEMSKTASEISRNCAVAAKSSESASKYAESGKAVIEGTVSIMNCIRDRVTQSASVIKKLETRSDAIGNIVGLIDEVADQTNLLALNAAIEAARAGEHGRGFAVVADEVRKLAERTGSATKEISNTIRAMQAETKEAVASMEEGVTDVETGSVEAAKSGQALEDILRQITAVHTEINQIAVASEQETSTTEEIAASIQQISEVMRQTSSTLQGNSEAWRQLAGLSEELETMVAQFRLR